MKLRVRYTVTFEANIIVDDDLDNPNESLADTFGDDIAEIDIPEGGRDKSVYQPDTFEVKLVEQINS